MNLMLERGAYAGILISVLSAQPDIGLKHITVPMTNNTFFLFHTFKMVCDRYIIKVEVVLLMDDNKINNSKNTFFFHDFKMVCDKYIIKVILVIDDNKSKIILITTCHINSYKKCCVPN